MITQRLMHKCKNEHCHFVKQIPLRIGVDHTTASHQFIVGRTDQLSQSCQAATCCIEGVGFNPFLKLSKLQKRKNVIPVHFL